MALGLLAGLLVGCGQRAPVARPTRLPTSAVPATPRPSPTTAPDVLSEVQVVDDLQAATDGLRGVEFQVIQAPQGASPAKVTAVNLRGRDPSGSFAALDASTKQAAAEAAMSAVGQLFPSALVQLTISDGGGKRLLNGQKLPRARPSVQVL